MKNWVVYSLISMFFAGLTSVIAKNGTQECQFRYRFGRKFNYSGPINFNYQINT